MTKRQREVKAARAKRKKARALLRAANNVLFAGRRRRHRRRGLLRRTLRRDTDERAAFYTWLHDFEVLLPAVARTAGSGQFTPEDLIAKATQAADRMKGEVAARRPGRHEEVRHFLGRHRLGKYADWHRWQHVFDNLVHVLAERSALNSDAVIDRACELTDAMLAEIEKRRPRRSTT